MDMHDALMTAGIAIVGLNLSCRFRSMSIESIIHLWAVVMIFCAVVFVVVFVLLPDFGEFEYGGTEKQPPDKWVWAWWVVALAVTWHVILLAFAFLNPGYRYWEFLPFAFPIVFLFFAIRTGIFANRFKISHPDRVRKEPKDILEARKRFGID